MVQLGIVNDSHKAGLCGRLLHFIADFVLHGFVFALYCIF